MKRICFVAQTIESSPEVLVFRTTSKFLSAEVSKVREFEAFKGHQKTLKIECVLFGFEKIEIPKFRHL